MKPDNILINYGKQNSPSRFSEVVLGDYGDVFDIEANPRSPEEDGHIIGAAIFRSPEAMFNLQWGPPTDIWSFGTTVGSLSA